VYQGETSPDVRKQIIQALFIGGDATRLAELARTEKDGELRRTAVHTLGLMGSKKTGDTLVAIYRSDKDPEIRRTAINALFIQGNAHALVEIARQETDPTLRKDIVEKLSLMKSKEATDFLMEILKK
jgi:HEAT repeat protein